MSEPSKTETKVDPRQRADAVVVSGENFKAFVDEKLATPAPVEISEDADDPDTVAAKELKALEDKKAAEKKAKEAENEEIDHPEPGKKEKLNERFSELTAKRKAAEADAKAAKEAVIAERQARETAEAERNALKAKYEPPKADEPEPRPEQFTDTTEFAKALKEWTAEQTRKEDAQKSAAERQAAERTTLVNAHKERMEAAKKANPGLDAKIEASTARVSDQMRDAILESEVGPAIIEHFADNPEVADKMGKLTVAQMLREFGKLEAKFAPDAGTRQTATVTNIKDAGKAEISKAPPPISPLNGGGSAVTRLTGADDVPRNMTYDQWKKLRESGKIQ